MGVIDSGLLSELVVGDNSFDVINPATGELIASVANQTGAAAAQAIESAECAMAIDHPVETRMQWLSGIAVGLAANRVDLSKLITLEQGKPIAESGAEVDYAAGFFRFFAECAEQIAPRSLAEPHSGANWTVHFRPAGVAALITPWNFPLAMLAKKLSAALAGGCAAVIKPAELTPLSAAALVRIAHTAGVPSNFVQLITGQADVIGPVFCTHPAVRVLSFTGSTEVGRLLAKESALSVKRLALELGGNAPFIVFADADVEAAADALLANKFRCAGQTCVCANRILVHSAIADSFQGAVADRMANLVVGNGMDMGVNIGPLINRAAWDKVDLHVRDAIANGAVRAHGETAAAPDHDWGCFYPPTLLVGCTDLMRVFQEETFGPVVSISTFDQETEAIARANAVDAGLAAYVFTADDSLIQRSAAALRFGHVGINTGAGPTPEAPFGGMKQSGYGREGGVEGFSEYVEPQTVARRIG